MNPLIRELAVQAGISTNIDTDYFDKDVNKWVDSFAENLAELVIKECLDKLEGMHFYQSVNHQNFPGAWHAGVDACIQELKDHFEIEE